MSWLATIMNPHSPTDVDSISNTVENLADDLALNGLSCLYPIQSLNVNMISTEHLATVLRVTYRWKDEIPGWYDARDMVKEACPRFNIKPEDLLYGML